MSLHDLFTFLSACLAKLQTFLANLKETEFSISHETIQTSRLTLVYGAKSKYSNFEGGLLSNGKNKIKIKFQF
jgi:hypothetical protein